MRAASPLPLSSGFSADLLILLAAANCSLNLLLEAGDAPAHRRRNRSHSLRSHSARPIPTATGRGSGHRNGSDLRIAREIEITLRCSWSGSAGLSPSRR